MPTRFRLQFEPEIVVMAVALLAVVGAGTAMFGWQPDSDTIEPISAMFDSILDGAAPAPAPAPSPARLSRTDRQPPANLSVQPLSPHPSILNAFEMDPGSSDAPFGESRYLMEI